MHADVWLSTSMYCSGCIVQSLITNVIFSSIQRIKNLFLAVYENTLNLVKLFTIPYFLTENL